LGGSPYFKPFFSSLRAALLMPRAPGAQRDVSLFLALPLDRRRQVRFPAFFAVLRGFRFPFAASEDDRPLRSSFFNKIGFCPMLGAFPAELVSAVAFPESFCFPFLPGSQVFAVRFFLVSSDS